MIRQIASHRSIRRYLPRPVPQKIAEDIVASAVRASTVGNMQLYSIVVTTDADLLEALAPCHFNQPAAVTAPMLMTFCADVHRFEKWCRQRGAEPCYDNFLWFINSVTDALLASENAALEAEAHGLGICYLGTTLYSADKITDILSLPHGVVPVMTLSVGYPAEQPPLTDRLPMDAVVHWQRYEEYSPEKIDEIWYEREHSQQTAELIEQNGLENLARIFTERRYPAADNLAFSESYYRLLQRQGFVR